MFTLLPMKLVRSTTEVLAIMDFSHVVDDLKISCLDMCAAYRHREGDWVSCVGQFLCVWQKK